MDKNAIHTFFHTSDDFILFGISVFAYYPCISILCFDNMHTWVHLAMYNIWEDQMILSHMGGEETIWGRWGGLRAVSCLH